MSDEEKPQPNVDDEHAEYQKYLDAAKELTVQQARLAEERAKLDADRKGFLDAMKLAEQGGRASAGRKEPSGEEKLDAEIKQMFKGTGLNPLE